MILLKNKHLLFVSLLVFVTFTFSNAQAVLPAYKARTEGLYITTANYALYRIDTTGKLEQLQPPPSDFAAPVQVFENSPELLCGAYETTDGRIVIYRNAITREEPYIFTPKPGRKLLQALPYSGSSGPMVMWAEGNKFITAYLERSGNKIVEESEKVVEMPGTPIAAFGEPSRLYVSCINKPGGRITNYDIYMNGKFGIEEDIRGILVAANFSGSEYSLITRGQKGALTDSIYFNQNGASAGAKPPKPGNYTCLAVSEYDLIVANEKGECWTGVIGFQKYPHPINWFKIELPETGIVGASFYKLKDGRNIPVFVTRQNKMLWPKVDSYFGPTVYSKISLKDIQPLLAKGDYSKKQNATAKPEVGTSTNSNDANATQPVIGGLLTGMNGGTAKVDDNELMDQGYWVVSSRRSYTDWPNRQQIIDLDGDGFTDVLTSYSEAGYIDIYYGDGTPRASRYTRLALTANGKGLLVAAADLNADKKTDLVVLNLADSSLRLLILERKNYYVSTWLGKLGIDNFMLYDYNADGNMDILAPGGIFLNNGKAAFTHYPTEKLEKNKMGFWIGANVGPEYLGGIGDLDGNGSIDFVKTATGKNLFDGIEIQLMPLVKNLQTQVRNQPLEKIKLIAPYDVESVAVADVNGDGKADIFAICKKAYKMLCYINKGNKEFELTEIKVGSNPSEMYRSPLLVRDVDNDGLQDVVASLGGYPQVFGCNQKNGMPRLKMPGVDNTKDRELNYGALAIGDITGDGLADHVVFQAELNKIDGMVSCGGNEYCMALTLYKGRKSGSDLVFEGRESPNSLARLAERGRRKTEENRAAAARNNSSNNQPNTSKSEIGPIKINESFTERYDIYRSWDKNGSPGQYNRMQNTVKFEFTPNKIEKYWLRGTFNFRWELAETYTIIYSEIRKDDDGTPVYLYQTSNNYQIAVNRGSFNRVIIMGGSKNVEYVSQ
ncbi:MAG: FG-GAP repeat domain-containing protein [Sediminibacterium sp.]